MDSYQRQPVRYMTDMIEQLLWHEKDCPAHSNQMRLEKDCNCMFSAAQEAITAAYRRGQDDQLDAERKIQAQAGKVPMGCSEWLAHGKIYEYNLYFIEKAHEEGIREARRAVEEASKKRPRCEDCLAAIDSLIKKTPTL